LGALWFSDLDLTTKNSKDNTKYHKGFLKVSWIIGIASFFCSVSFGSTKREVAEGKKKYEKALLMITDKLNNNNSQPNQSSTGNHYNKISYKK